MKNICLLLLMLTVSAPAFADYSEDLAKMKAIDATVIQLIRESFNAFGGWRGAQMSSSKEGETLYAARGTPFPDARDQYLSVKGGKTFFIAHFRGKGSVKMMHDALKILQSLAPNLRSDWGERIDSSGDGGVNTQVGEYICNTSKMTEGTLVIGPIEDKQIAVDKARKDAKALEDAKYANINSGSPEMDAVARVRYLDGWGDVEQSFHDLYVLKADNYYDNTIGNALSAKVGVHYSAPNWLGANDAYYLKDTTGLGIMLMLFFKYSDAHTYDILRSVRGDFNQVYRYHPEYGKVKVFSAENATWLYMDRDGMSTAMYCFDTSLSSSYRGLRVIIMQSFRLAERRAAKIAKESMEAQAAAMYKKAQQDGDAYNLAHASKPTDNSALLKVQNKLNEQAQQDKLHQQSVDYYNKIHPYGEGTNDYKGRPIR